MGSSSGSLLEGMLTHRTAAWAGAGSSGGPASAWLILQLVAQGDGEDGNGTGVQGNGTGVQGNGTGVQTGVAACAERGLGGEAAELYQCVDVTVAGATTGAAMAALAAAEAAIRRALEVATKRVLLRVVDETRLPDPRLLPGAAFGLDELRCDTFELHQRLHANKPRALRALCAALSPFSVACDDGSQFVYRRMASDDTYLLQMRLREEEPRPLLRAGGPGGVAYLLGPDGSPTTLTRSASITSAPSADGDDGPGASARAGTPILGAASPADASAADGSLGAAGGWRRRRLFVDLRVLGLTEHDAPPQREAAEAQCGASGAEHPLSDMTEGLVNHLARKMEELVLGTLSMLLQRNPDLKLSAQDVLFLCPPKAPPLATATVELPPTPLPPPSPPPPPAGQSSP
eukprot:scaffold26206_cov90-Isochrysis_galbana.AAC.1